MARYRITSRDVACPRTALAAAVAGSSSSYAGLSRMIGRDDGYLARFVREGVPVALPADVHGTLATFFGVHPRLLGVRDLWADRGPLELAA